MQKGSFEREASEAGEDTDVYIFLKYFKIVPYSLGQKSADRMKAKDVAKKLAELSKEHFGSFLSASGGSFHAAQWKAWYDAKKDKLGSVPIQVTDSAPTVSPTIGSLEAMRGLIWAWRGAASGAQPHTSQGEPAWAASRALAGLSPSGRRGQSAHCLYSRCRFTCGTTATSRS